jgi:hypothetical protein
MLTPTLQAREYLKTGGPHGLGRKYDFAAIQWMETMNTSSGMFDQAFSESVIDSFDFDNPANKGWKCIEGGTSLVTDAMVNRLKTKPQLNKRVDSIHHDWLNIKPDPTNPHGTMSVNVVGEKEPRGG